MTLHTIQVYGVGVLAEVTHSSYEGNRAPRAQRVAI